MNHLIWRNSPGCAAERMPVAVALLLAFTVALGATRAHAEEGQTLPDSGWEITVERVQTLAQMRGHHTNFPFAEILPNGDIMVEYSVGQHGGKEWKRALVSHDRGATWAEPNQATHCMNQAVRVDGTVVSLWCWGGEEREEGLFDGRLFWSEDGGATWGQKTVPVKMPAGVKAFTHRSMVAMPDGSLLCTYYSNRPGQAKYHSGLLRSTDAGATWEYFGDIAYDPQAPGEGYCEPVVARLENGDLLCMLRTGGPMFQTRSTDGGKTWAEPHVVQDHGVCPDLCLMGNGVLVCAYGRPNAGIMFSYDGTGRKWEDAQDLYRGTGSSYTTVREVEPGLLMYFYDQSGFVRTAGPGPMNEIRVAYVRVKKADGP